MLTLQGRIMQQLRGQRLQKVFPDKESISHLFVAIGGRVLSFKSHEARIYTLPENKKILQKQHIGRRALKLASKLAFKLAFKLASTSRNDLVSHFPCFKPLAPTKQRLAALRPGVAGMIKHFLRGEETPLVTSARLQGQICHSELNIIIN